MRETISAKQTYSISGTVGKSEINAANKENQAVVRMNTIFPIDRLTITTPDRNFQRTVVVHVKQGSGEWQRWAQGTIYNFDTPSARESQLAIDIPEIAAREFLLVFRNLDSPPVSITGVTGEGYRRLVIFKQSDRKMYLFWGNPQASQPQYDLAGIIQKQNLDTLPIANLGQAQANTQFAAARQGCRLPSVTNICFMSWWCWG